MESKIRAKITGQEDLDLQKDIDRHEFELQKEKDLHKSDIFYRNVVNWSIVISAIMLAGIVGYVFWILDNSEKIHWAIEGVKYLGGIILGAVGGSKINNKGK
jgi:ABC-type siderophore export system fused ATPase/permease subunit